MHIGPIVRKRKNEKRYARYVATKKPGCDFCALSTDAEQVRKSAAHFWLIDNIFPYDMWDGLDVLDHAMVVPKRHVDSIAHFSEEESKQYLGLLAEYESQGYSVYARSPHNISKSVAHQHTHLIKLGNTKKKAVFFIRKPHIVIYI